jgi:hypothetical protein
MQRRVFGTAALRVSAFAVLLASFACCAGPTETVEQASEAMSPLPANESSPLLPPVPQVTTEELAELEQFVRAALPKWHVYASGFDYDLGTAPGPHGGKPYYSHPQEIDRHCQLALIPEGGNDLPETWIFLRYEHYWMKGASYLTDDLKLSVFDVLGILLALEDAGPEPPQLWSRERLRGVLDSLQDESGPYGVLPTVPPDWGVDNHTCTGGPPPIGTRPSPPNSHGPGNSAPPHRSHEWNGPTLPPPPPWNGVLPKDKPVGKYPGWDKPHPGEWAEKFRCGGKVYEGYKSDCPDFQRKPIGERWTKPFDELSRDLASNAQHTLELIRTSPNCTFMCKLIGAMPPLLHMVCIEAPVVHPVMRVICAVFGSLKVTVGASIAGLKFDDSCEKWCQKPPQGAPGRQP